MLAAIDVGSNTLRMLIGEFVAGRLQKENYFRQITRLGGGYVPGKGLAAESMERTLSALCSFSRQLQHDQVRTVRAVGTAALRRAENRLQFLEMVQQRTGLQIEVIDGREEAELSAAGVLTVIEPLPKTSLIVDIGGGSTEFILCRGREYLFQQSYPLGVVRLSEEAANEPQRRQLILAMLRELQLALRRAGHPLNAYPGCQLIGTAGTVTTLAAMQLRMVDYDWRLINNQTLNLVWLKTALAQVAPMPLEQRASLPGLEEGRADLIVPGLEILISLCKFTGKEQLKVADSGLLEGVLLTMSSAEII